MNYRLEKRQSGQAIVEMCIGLVGILAVFLGLIFVAGLSISNIKTYISAKTSAEYGSRNDNAVVGAGSSIYTWDYGDPRNGGDDLPFTADDRIVSTGVTNAGTLFQNQVRSAAYSEGELDGSYDYMAIDQLQEYVRNNFTDSLVDLFLPAANLTCSSSSYDVNIYTLNSDITNRGNQLQTLMLNFGNIFSVRVDEINLREMEANQVYMPFNGDASGSTP